MTDIKNIYKELEEIAKRKSEVESKLMDAILCVVRETGKESPRIERRIAPNTFVVKSSDLINGTWSPTYYDNAKASDLIADFIKKCGVEECKGKLKELLDKSDGSVVYIVASNKPKYEGGYKNAVDAELIKNIIEKL